MKAGLINQEGGVLALLEEKTDKENLLGQVISIIDRLIGDKKEIKGIGIGTAGRVNAETGSIHFATANLPGWEGTEVKKLIEGRFNLPTVVDNDANTAAFAEMELGSALNEKNFMCITLGTGVGAGLILNGEVHHGRNGGAGEVGHMIFMPNGRPCNCGKNGCWEQYVSGTALSLDIKDSALGNQNIGPVELFKLADEQNPIASIIVDRFITNLAIGIVSLQSILDLECFVVGGGVISSSDTWWNSFLTKLDGMAEQPISVKKAMLKNDAGMLGAALMAGRYAAVHSTNY